MRQLLGYLAFALFFSLINCNVVVQNCPHQGEDHTSHDGESTPPTAPSQLPRQGNDMPNTPLNGADDKGYSRTPMIGGIGGDNCFWDSLMVKGIIAIDKMNMFYTDDEIKGFQVTYVADDGRVFEEHLGDPDHGSSQDLYLEGRKDIVGVELSTNGNVVNHISFVIQERDTMETETYTYGTPGSHKFYLNGLILHFEGCLGTALSSLGIYYTDRAVKGPKFGGSGGTYWDDISHTQCSPIINIENITIWHGAAIDAIQVQYIGLSGKSVAGWKHGGSGGEKVSFDLEPGEYIVQLDTKSSSDLLDEVTFITKKQDGTKTTYGPYGMPSEASMSSTALGRIIGFYGGSGNVIDYLGVYLAENSFV